MRLWQQFISTHTGTAADVPLGKTVAGIPAGRTGSEEKISVAPLNVILVLSCFFFPFFLICMWAPFSERVYEPPPRVPQIQSSLSGKLYTSGRLLAHLHVFLYGLTHPCRSAGSGAESRRRVVHAVQVKQQMKTKTMGRRRHTAFRHYGSS